MRLFLFVFLLDLGPLALFAQDSSAGVVHFKNSGNPPRERGTTWQLSTSFMERETSRNVTMRTLKPWADCTVSIRTTQRRPRFNSYAPRRRNWREPDGRRLEAPRSE